MTSRPYDAPVQTQFPQPPHQFRDAEGDVIRVETANSDDPETIDRLIDMYEEFHPADRAQGIPPVHPEGIASWLDLVVGSGPDVIAIYDGRVVGHATLVPENDTGEYELAIFVLRGFQERGIGTSLLDHLLGEAQAVGIEYIWLTVERWNRRALSLYQSVGFRSTKSGSFDLEMTIRLAASTE